MGRSTARAATPPTSDRPRTRSVVGKNDLAVKSPLSYQKKAKSPGPHVTRRLQSPAIDSTDDSEDGGKAYGGGESESSPLKRVSRRSRRSGTPKKRKRTSKPPKNESIALANASTPCLGFSEPSPDLNSSPIKPVARAKSGHAEHDSSPTKKKTVAFSDPVLQDVSHSPCRAPDADKGTPRKSILKNIHGGPSPAHARSPHTALGQSHTLHSDTSLDFWQPGTIVQLEPKSPRLPCLVASSLQALQSGGFDRKFEVYASLNLIFKHNVASTIHDIFARPVAVPSELVATDLWRDSGLEAAFAGANVAKTGNGSEKPSESVPEALVFFSYAQRDVQLLESRLFGSSSPLKKENSPPDFGADNGTGKVRADTSGGAGKARADPSGGAKKAEQAFDPFEARTLNQALKFIAQFFAVPQLSSALPPQTIRWCYLHCCEILVKPNLSKQLVSSYMCVIKDFNFPAKQKAAIFDSSTPEHVLSTLLNMEGFMSSSLINEKFIAMRNLVSHFPATMAKNFHHWFPGLVLNLCDLSFVLYYKIADAGVMTLLEAARNFLDSAQLCQMTRGFLESSPNSEKSWVTESPVTLGSFRGQKTLDFVVDTLKVLCSDGKYKYAMDMWVGISLLLGNFQKWPHLSTWLKIHKLCFNADSFAAKEIAISSWKVVVYRMCHEMINDVAQDPGSLNSPRKDATKDVTNSAGPKDDPKVSAFDESLRLKAKLLIHPFVSTSHVPEEIISALHSCFLSVLYTLLNSQTKFSVRVLQTIWDRVVHPVLVNLYLHKNAAGRSHELGVQVVTRLLKASPPSNERLFNGLRCLWNENIPLADINCMSPRWVFFRFDKVLPILLVIFGSVKISAESKMGAFASFLNSVKIYTKKEVSASDNTYDIIDNLPPCLDALFQHSNVGYDDVFKLLVNLNDTFGAPLLLAEEGNVYQTILDHCAGTLTSQQLHGIMNMIYGALGERKSFRFFSMLERVEKKVQRPEILQFLSDSLNQKKYTKFGNSELIVLGRIFTRLDTNFNNIAKKVIQHIVLLKMEDFDQMVARLNIVAWNAHIFSFFVVLMHNAPYEHLNRATESLIKKRGDFPEMVRLLIEHAFDSELLAIKDELTRVENDPEVEALLWTYLRGHGDHGFVDALLSQAELRGNVQDIVKGRWELFPLLKAAEEQRHSRSHCNEHTSGSLEIFDLSPKASFEIAESQTGSFSESLKRQSEHPLRDPKRRQPSKVGSKESVEPNRGSQVNFRANSSSIQSLKVEGERGAGSANTVTDVTGETNAETISAGQTNTNEIVENHTTDNQTSSNQTSQDNTRQNDSSQNGNSQNNTKQNTSQNASQNTSQNNTSQNNTSQNASQNNTSQNTSQNDTSQNASQNNTSQNTSQNNTSQNASQNNTSQNTSQNNTSQNASQSQTKTEQGSGETNPTKFSLSKILNHSEDAIQLMGNDAPCASAETQTHNQLVPAPAEANGAVLFPKATDEAIDRTRSLQRLVTAISEQELAQMSNSEKFALETAMLELMLRMRRT